MLNNISDILLDELYKIKFYSIDDAINSPIKSKTCFIIANEKITQSGKIGRYFTVFPSFKNFLLHRNEFINCHEILVDHCNSKPNISGRLVFDFDIKVKNIPDNFKEQIEKTTINVINIFFDNIDTDIIDFIWSTSKNPNKFSKHLTVKHIYFDNWIVMSKIFYKLFCLQWDTEYDWIRSQDLIDFQIVRKKGSLRMVGSTKINGFPLLFDNKKHILTDSLIRIYFKNQRDIEQCVCIKHLNSNVPKHIFEYQSIQNKHTKTFNYNTFNNTINNQFNNQFYDTIVYDKTFELCNTIQPDVFIYGKISGDIVSLLRKKSFKCLISGKVHDNENAYCKILKDNNDRFYKIIFGCFRKCSDKKNIFLGYIRISDNNIFINPKYDASKNELPKNSNTRYSIYQYLHDNNFNR